MNFAFRTLAFHTAAALYVSTENLTVLLALGKSQ